jgi:hypothetical protein
MAKKTFAWPNDARVAFVLGIAFEAWDRTKPSRGRALQGSAIPASAVCRWDYSTETFREFGAKIGLKRLLDICDRYDLKVSMPINGLTCQYWPDLVRSLYMLNREQERDNIFNTVEAIASLTGEKPTGWSSPGVRSTHKTLELNVEAGLLYNCDYHDDEMPYPRSAGGKMLIMIPHQYTINDHRMEEEGTRHDFFEKFKDEFDYRYEIGVREPTMMNVITHAYLSSRIPLIDTFEQIIKYAKRHEHVWFARRGDIAAWARRYYEEETAT